MTRRTFLALALLVLAVGGVLRTVWLTSDPPSTNGVGVVWHDEGPWTHNARNKALWGTWVTDNWNPVYIAPVFTALEYGSFRAFGVGTWQARVVPVVSGLVAIGFLMAGLAAVSSRSAAVIGGSLLATNYVSIMWNRAALMESTMTAFIVIGWAAYALSREKPVWGYVAGAAAVLAFFTKASAAFFIGALILEVVLTRWFGSRRGEPAQPGTGGATRALIGLAVAGLAIGVVFVLPHWSEFQFYNWQMSVTRKPSYSLEALMTRASWLPLVHDFFTWMWPVFLLACVSLVNVAAELWRAPHSAKRLLALWVLVGLVELVVHDSGNERRYVMFLPALIALASMWLAGSGHTGVSSLSRSIRLASLPLIAGLGYLVAGSLVRMLFLDDVRAGHLHTTVVISAAVAALAAAAALLPRAGAWIGLGRRALPVPVAAVAILFPVLVDGLHFGQWAAHRQDLNYQASREVGRLLPPGTLVQGKLANGLALENGIRPIFIGHDFGNYGDRLQRDDVRYILTYVSPSVGFESQAGSGLIQEILDRYPHQHTVATFAVNETGGPDRAALLDKLPGPDRRAPD